MKASSDDSKLIPSATTEAMRIIVKIMVEVLGNIAIVIKEIKQISE